MQPLILPYEGHWPEIAPDAFVAPDVTLVGRIKLGPQANVWYKCMFRADEEPIVIGARTNIQDGTVIHITGGKFATIIGDDVTVGHKCMLHACTLESGSFVGMGATVLDGCVIETGAQLAAGAVLPPGKRIPSGQLWAGNPARHLRDLSPEQIARFKITVAKYMEFSGKHRAAIEQARIALKSAAE
jgi:carbonic anhydrase/acetyltransferase-like protein (isoleucine patch superfamily)